MTQTIAQQLAGFAEDCTYDTLPQAVRARTKLYILDTIGAIQAGASEQSTQIIANVLFRSDENSNCVVIGRSGRTSPQIASVINGAAAHAVEIDDDHRESALHPGAVVVPTALAACEEVAADGKTLIAAVAVGYEVAVRVGMAMGGTQDRVGFHSTSTCGVFGAAAAASMVFGLSSGQFAAALGIAGSQSCGLQEWKADGSWTKRFHAGKAAEAGVISAMMAQHGYTGPDTVFEGEYGFLKAFSGVEKSYPEEITRDLGSRFLGSETAFKPYACCRFSHQLIDAVRQLKKEHGISVADVEHVDIRIYTTGFRALFEPKYRSYRPATIVDAQFSAPYIVAITLLHDTVLPQHFNESLIVNSDVLSLMDRIDGHPEEDFETQFPEKYGTNITIVLKNGQSVSAYADVASGDPVHPEYLRSPHLFAKEVVQKYRDLLAVSSLSEELIDTIIDRVDRLEQLSDVRNLSSLLDEKQ